MDKFRAGDKIVCIKVDPFHMRFTVGETYTVLRAHPEFIEIKDDYYDTKRVRPVNFVHQTKLSAKLYDKV